MTQQTHLSANCRADVLCGALMNQTRRRFIGGSDYSLQRSYGLSLLPWGTMRSPIHTGWRHPHTLRRGVT